MVLVCLPGCCGVGVSDRVCVVVLMCSQELLCLSGAGGAGMSFVVLVHHLSRDGAAVFRRGDGSLHLHRRHRHC